MDPGDKKTILREEFLKNKEENCNLGSMMVIVTSKSWTGVLTLAFCLVAIVFWSFLGDIPVEILGPGFIINGDGNFIVESPSSGRVIKIHSSEKELIKKGQLLFSLQDLNLEAQIKSARKNYESSIEQLEAYKIKENLKVQEERRVVLQTIEANEKLIEMTYQELEFLNQEIEWQRELHLDGLITLIQINQTQIKINQQYETLKECKIAIDKAKSALIRIEDLIQEQSYEAKIQAALDNLNELNVKKELMDIRSPHDGRVITIPIAQDNIIKEGDRVLWGEKLHSQENHHQCYLFINSETEQKVKPGMLAFIRVSSIDYKLYGELIAKVVEVSDFPVSSSEIFKIIGNNNVVNSFTSNGTKAPLQIIIQPIKSDNTISGYLWTSEKGPPGKIQSGDIISGRIRIKNRHPIEYVLPLIRNLETSSHWCPES